MAAFKTVSANMLLNIYNIYIEEKIKNTYVLYLYIYNIGSYRRHNNDFKRKGEEILKFN